MGRAAGAFRRETAGAPSRIAASVTARPPPEEARIVTYSAGSAVRAAIQGLARAGRDHPILLSEARPALEGVALAESLAATGLPVRLVTDAALPGELRRGDILWLGADGLIPAGLVHKVGTAPLTRAARAAGVPVVVLAGRHKRVGPDLAGRLDPAEGGDPGAVYRGSVDAIEPANPLFDLTPWERIDIVIGEDGSRKAAEARAGLEGIRGSPALASILSRPV